MHPSCQTRRTTMTSDCHCISAWHPTARSCLPGGPVEDLASSGRATIPYLLVTRNHVLSEAIPILRPYARDSGKMIGSLGMAMIPYMEEHVDDDGLLDITEQLPDPLRMFCRDLRAGRKPVRQWTRELEEALGWEFLSRILTMIDGRGHPVLVGYLSPCVIPLYYMEY